MKGVIYIIENNINQKVYIGQTIQNIKNRFQTHCRMLKKRRNMRITIAINKYGKENFSIRILEECDFSNLNEREIFYISKYDSYKNGYNSTLGGKSLNYPYGKSKINTIDQDIICELYIDGFSLREIAKEYSVDKWTIKNILIKNNIILNNKRVYKFTHELLAEIKSLLDSGVPGKEVSEKYKISKAYASQIKNGSRKI